ncbi:MAG: cache domain-containing protein, partial [Candidatus Theseobacter exili]|nr:cache domain-containing protein [Candidatus Theseobacter exili]
MVRRTLKLELSAYFFFLVILPIIIVTMLFYYELRQSTRKMVEEGLSKLAFEVGLEVEGTIFEACNHIVALSNNDIVKSEEASIVEKQHEFQKVYDLYKTFNTITLLDLDGAVLTSTNYNYRGEWKNKSWIKLAKKDIPSVSPPYVILHPTRFAMDVAIPVVNLDGRIKSILVGQFNLKIIWEIIDRISLGKTGFVFLIDK